MDEERARKRRKAESLKEGANLDWYGLIIIVGLALVLVIRALLVGAREGGSVTSMDMQVLSVKEHFPEALTVAREWRSDAILESTEAWFQPRNGPGTLGISYAFRSPSDPVAGLLVWIIQEEDGMKTEWEEVDQPPDKPLRDAIDPMQQLLDSQEALSIILQSGGAEFIAEHAMTRWPLGLHLEYRHPGSSEGPLVWRATFADRATLDSEGIRIDAYTGELVD